MKYVVGLSVLLLMSLQAAAQGDASPQQGESVEKKDSAPDQEKRQKRLEERLNALEEIVVTPSRSEHSLFETAIGATSVDSQELLERQPRTVAEALRYKPGIWVQKTGHVGGAPIIRGFMGNRVIYLFDGIRRNTAGIFGGPNSFLQTIDALDVDRIEVIRGPGSVLYGSDAIGGVVNVVSNEEPLFSDELEFHGRTLFRYGSVDNEVSARQEFSLSTPEIYFHAGGTFRDIDDLEGGGGVGEQKPSGWSEGNWDAQLDWALTDDQTLEFFVQDYRRDDARRFDRPNRVEEANRELYGIRYEAHDLNDAIEALNATVYYQNQRRYNDDSNSDSDSDEETFGFDAQVETPLGDRLKLTWGTQFYIDDIEKKDPQRNREDPDVTWTNFALFALAEWQATEDLRVDLGLRWDHYSLESDPPPFAKLPGAVQDAINSGSFSLNDLDLDQSGDALTGSIGVVYSLTDNINWVAHVGRAFRAPNKSDQLSFGQFTFGFNVPSGSLDPESSWTFETGFHFSYPNFAAAVTGFYTILDDPIVREQSTFNGAAFIDVNGNGVQDPDESVFRKVNGDGQIDVKGVELEAQWYLPQAWTEDWLGDTAISLYGNFSWIEGRDSGKKEPLDRAFPLNGLIGLRVEDSRDPAESVWWASLEMWMVDRFDRIPSDRVNRDPAFKINPQDRNSGLLRAGGAVPGFTTFSFRAGARLCDNATLTFALENFTDKKYRVKDSRIEAPGLNAVVGLEITF